jgi:hypothetical protein
VPLLHRSRAHHAPQPIKLKSEPTVLDHKRRNELCRAILGIATTGNHRSKPHRHRANVAEKQLL